MAEDKDKKQAPSNSEKESSVKKDSVESVKAGEKEKVSAPADKAEVPKEKVQASEKKESSGEDKVSAKKEEPVKKEEPAKEEVKEEVKASEEKPSSKGLKLEGLFAFKMSMSTFYNDKGESVPVTALKYEPCFVSQLKTKEKESYEAVQVAFKAQKNKRCTKAQIQHLKPAGFKEGARFVRELRQSLPEGIKAGEEVSIESLKKGDLLKISSLSKGRGFAGVMKKWNFAGGRASHGSKSHRRTGSIGQHTEPSRVMPGRKMPGQYGYKKVSRLKVPVVEVLPDEGIIFVKGPVPGARNTLVSLRKMS